VNYLEYPVPENSIRAGIGEYGDWATVVQLAFMEPQLTGKHPFVRVVTNEAGTSSLVNGAADFIPAEAKLVKDIKSRGVSASLAVLEDVWIYTTVSRSGSRAVVSGDNIGIVEAVAKQISEAFPEPLKPDDSTVPVHIWHQSNNGGTAKRRKLEVPRWREIRNNYSEQVRLQLDQLMEMERPGGNGRLILWHGIPGTGKTTAIRALMAEWSNWCESHYIIDPETAFADPAYLSELMTRRFSSTISDLPWYEDDDDEEPENKSEKWRLLIAEDSDEFLRADARQTAGAALGRLLNLSDGILGQGSNTLILLTTNENMRELHPALIRPGRALANTEFTRLDMAEANAWLQGDATVGSAKTLAELFELRGETKRIGGANGPQQRIGFSA